MPYSDVIGGIYKIVNTSTNECYVGQSVNMRKRISEHFRLLRSNKHPNPHLQNSYNKYGHDSFRFDFEVVCEDYSEMDMLEEAFINHDAKFSSPVAFNIASFAKAPMRGKKHTESTKSQIRQAKLNSDFDYSNPTWRKSLSDGQLGRVLRDKKQCEQIAFIVHNDHLSYAERARILGSDASSVRKKYIHYISKKELFPWLPHTSPVQ